jgi:hypothetical protein
MNPDGTGLELFCYGFRNEFDICFNDQGELFTYDADMEWDIGSPWYRPTRVNHCVSGADYGWRSGSGKWPNYYPDSLPTTLDIGPGSPTGVVAGTGAKFPAKYQHAIYINDWTYGTMWAIHLESKGASYLATKEEFVFGKPLPLTDLVIHPQDGAMYFAVGGRKSQSGVYRVTYVGEESTAPVKATPLDEEARMRHAIEALHIGSADPQKALATAWGYLSHSDRHVRNAARVAIEKLPVELWQEKALSEKQPVALPSRPSSLSHASAEPNPATKAEKPLRSPNPPPASPFRPSSHTTSNCKTASSSPSAPSSRLPATNSPPCVPFSSSSPASANPTPTSAKKSPHPSIPSTPRPTPPSIASSARSSSPSTANKSSARPSL